MRENNISSSLVTLAASQPGLSELSCARLVIEQYLQTASSAAGVNFVPHCVIVVPRVPCVNFVPDHTGHGLTHGSSHGARVLTSSHHTDHTHHSGVITSHGARIMLDPDFLHRGSRAGVVTARSENNRFQK